MGRAAPVTTGAVVVAILRGILSFVTGLGPDIAGFIVPILKGLSVIATVGIGTRATTDYNSQETRLKAVGYPGWAFIAGPVGYLTGTIQAVNQQVVAYLSIFSRRATRALNQQYPENDLSPPEIVQAYIQSDISKQEAYARLRTYGYNEIQADHLFTINGEPIAPGQALDLLNRWKSGLFKLAGRYDEEWVRQSLNESRLKPKYTEAILDLRTQLLGASDYIRLAVKDAFTTDPALRQALDEDYPAELGPRLTALGYSDEDARATWRAHWDLPSPTQVFEMLHRGTLPPGEPDKVVSDYLRQADYDPRWREPLKAISYNPVTRTDAKRAYKLGLGGFDEKRLHKAFTDLGYTAADADLLVEFTRLDVGEEARQERELLVGPVRSQALNMYRARRITEDELRKVLSNLKYPKEIVDRYIADIQFARDADHRDEVAAAVKSAYTKALRTRDDTRAILLSNGWSGEGADEILNTWTLIREATELQPHQSAQRDLTKTEIVGAYADALIDRTEAAKLLESMGYDPNEAETILGIQDAKARAQKLSDDTENVHLNYLRFAYDDDTASTALMTLGVPTTRIRNLVMKWGREREKAVPDFSLTVLENMVKARVMPEDVAQGYLARQGFTSEQQFYLLNWWLGRRETAQARQTAK